MSELFTLKSNDWVKGLITAVLGSVIVAVTTAFGAIVTQPGFDVFTVDWGDVLHNMINLMIVGGYAAITGYLGKNFLTDSKGDVLGISTTQKS